MLRNLYRLYLYTIFIALLIFADVALTMLLNTLLLLTSLRADYIQAPTQAAVVQALVFSGVALVIVGLLGGLHYWLIRRDIQHDPVAGSSGIRSFFLNMTEGIALAIAVATVGFS